MKQRNLPLIILRKRTLNMWVVRIRLDGVRLN